MTEMFPLSVPAIPFTGATGGWECFPSPVSLLLDLPMYYFMSECYEYYLLAAMVAYLFVRFLDVCSTMHFCQPNAALFACLCYFFYIARHPFLHY